ncbi:MAG: NfeD family protein [Planctomycetota bacterium]
MTRTTSSPRRFAAAVRRATALACLAAGLLGAFTASRVPGEARAAGATAAVGAVEATSAAGRPSPARARGRAPKPSPTNVAVAKHTAGPRVLLSSAARSAPAASAQDLVAGVVHLRSSVARSAPPAASAQDLAAGVVHLRIEGELDIGHQALLARASSAARDSGDRLVVELDTPGGEVQLAWRIARLLDEASSDGVRTVAWINDKALSAGALLALACDDIYLRATASFGSAQAIAVGPGGVVGVPADEVVEEKTGSSWRSSFRAFAEIRGRSPVLAEAMVDPDVEVRRVRVGQEERVVGEKEWDDLRDQGAEVKLLETVSSRGELLNLTAAEAVRLQMADARADSLDEVLARIGMPGAAPRSFERSASEDLAALLFRLGPLLLILGLVFAYTEFKAPGFGAAGLLSIACFAVMLFGRYLVGLAEIPHLVLMALGMVLLAVELFLVPGSVWVGLLGALLVLAGLMWASLSTGYGFEYEMDREIAVDSAFRLTVFGAVAAAAIWTLSLLLPKTPAYGALAVAPTDTRATTASALPEAEGPHGSAARVGATGRALTVLRPVGKVALDGAAEIDYEARSSGTEIDAGAPVRVVEVRGGRLVVEAQKEA